MAISLRTLSFYSKITAHIYTFTTNGGPYSYPKGEIDSDFVAKGAFVEILTLTYRRLS